MYKIKCNSFSEPDELKYRYNEDDTSKSFIGLNQSDFTARTVECCGWINITDFGFEPFDEYLGDRVEVLTWITKEFVVHFPEGWSVSIKPERFTLFSVLTQSQKEWFPYLLNLGWQQMPSFNNPNTTNICTPFMYIPEERKDSEI